MQLKYSVLTLCTAAALLTGCGGKSSNSSSESETAAVTSTTAAADVSATVVTSSVTTKAATTAAKTTEPVTFDVTETTEPSETTTSAETTKFIPPEVKVSEGSDECLETARQFYQAYLDQDAEAVYAMFEKSEIDGYNELIAPELGESSAKEVFRRAAVIRAIEASMDNIRQIMDYYADSESDKWSFNIRESDLEEISETELESFNESLGTSYTRAFTCQYMFYNDDSNNRSFTGNSASFVELDGKWYLSYSSVMGTDLLNFLEVEGVYTENDDENN